MTEREPTPTTPRPDAVLGDEQLDEIRDRERRATPRATSWMLSSSIKALTRDETFHICYSQLDVDRLLAALAAARTREEGLRTTNARLRAALRRIAHSDLDVVTSYVAAEFRHVAISALQDTPDAR